MQLCVCICVCVLGEDMFLFVGLGLGEDSTISNQLYVPQTQWPALAAQDEVQ